MNPTAPEIIISPYIRSPLPFSPAVSYEVPPVADASKGSHAWRFARRIAAITMATGAFLGSASPALGESQDVQSMDTGMHLTLDQVHNNILAVPQDGGYTPWPVPDTEHTKKVYLNPTPIYTPPSAEYNNVEQGKRAEHNGHVAEGILAGVLAIGAVIAIAGLLIRKSHYDMRRGPEQGSIRPGTGLVGYAPGDDPPTGSAAAYVDENYRGYPNVL
jgi:hypothetical protein